MFKKFCYYRNAVKRFRSRENFCKEKALFFIIIKEKPYERVSLYVKLFIRFLLQISCNTYKFYLLTCLQTLTTC